MDIDHHATLGLAPDATLGDVKRAYRRLAMRWHPDRNTDPAATERFKAIRAAYEQIVAVDTSEADKTDVPETGEAEEVPQTAADSA